MNEEEQLTIPEALNRMLQFYNLGDYDNAAAIGQLILNVAPDQEGALNLMCVVAIARADMEHAEQFALRAIQLYPATYGHHLNLGHIFVNMGQDLAAAESYETVIRLFPSSFDAYKNLLAIYGKLCKKREVDVLLEKFETSVVLINDALNVGVHVAEIVLLAKFLAEMCQITNFLLLMQANEYHEKIVQAAYNAGLLIQKIANNYADPALASIAADLLANYTQVQSHIFFVPKFPLTLQIEPTNECNLACPMCPRTNDMKRSAGNLSPETWGKIFENWGNNISTDGYLTGGSYGVRSIKLFFLGEPLLHPELNMFIADAKKRGIFIQVQTNGVPLKNKRKRIDLLNAKPNIIGISVDGHDRKSYQIARDGTDWDRIVESIAALNTERKELGLEHEVSIQVVNIMVDRDDMIERNRIVEFMQPLIGITDLISVIPLDRTHAPIYFDSKGGTVSYENDKASINVSLDSPSCLECLNKLNVLRDGTITPCCVDTNGKLRLGHVDDGIDNVWNSSRSIALRKAHLTRTLEGYEYCKACLGWSHNKMTEVDSFFPNKL